MGPFVMGPFVMGPFVMGTFVMVPFVMGPFVMGPLVMGPYVGVPFKLRHFLARFLRSEGASYKNSNCEHRQRRITMRMTRLGPP
jgi:hypothetical protein